MMKRLLCLVLCLMLALPAAVAETADTLPKRFVRQLSGGNGARGYISITASGLADWLNLLLPFTATDIQIRAIGEKQGEMSDSIADDDDWQVKFYVKDNAENEAGTTWLYGNPEGVYFQSELLPDTLLTIPVEQVHLLYQLFRGEFNELFFSFDPMEMKKPGENGNVSAYQAIAEILDIPDEEWTSKWQPVLEKYFLHLDLWLAGYGDPAFLTGDTGALTMSAAYTIPAEDLKAEAKYIIGQMLFDNDLQSLLLPYVTMEQRITYLNPQMLYFYEASIDALELTGDVVLSREMSAMGEVVNTTIALPLPVLPKTLSAPVNKAAKALFGLAYDDLLDSMDRMTLKQSSDEMSVTLSGEKRSIEITSLDVSSEENVEKREGFLHITPNEGNQESAVKAVYTCSFSHRIWQDEKYLDHDTTQFAFTIEPDPEMVSLDESILSNAVEFKPVSVDFALDYRNNPYQENSAVQVNVNLDAKLPDAEVAVEAVLRITTQVAMENLATAGAEDFTKLPEERKAAMLTSFVLNAQNIMATLYEEPADPETVLAEPNAEPTSVPPISE